MTCGVLRLRWGRVPRWSVIPLWTALNSISGSSCGFHHLPTRYRIYSARHHCPSSSPSYSSSRRSRLGESIDEAPQFRSILKSHFQLVAVLPVDIPPRLILSGRVLYPGVSSAAQSGPTHRQTPFSDSPTSKGGVDHYLPLHPPTSHHHLSFQSPACSLGLQRASTHSLSMR